MVERKLKRGAEWQTMKAIEKGRLNGWQRIGVVASVLWAIGGAFWGFNIGYHEGGDVDRDFEVCRAGTQYRYQHQGTPRYTTDDLIKDLGKCQSEYARANKEATSTGSLYAVLLALLPIPLGWLAVYKFIALLRWIREGFTA
jgi:hypothetical protein